MDYLNQRDLEELKYLRKKADDMDKYSLADMVKKWQIYLKGSRISCTDQFKSDMVCSSYLKDFNKGQSSNLFVAEYKSLCEHYISLLNETN